MNQNEQHLEQLISELLDRHDIEDILSELCSRVYSKKEAFAMLGDRQSAARWGKVAEMLDIATSNISWELN